MKTVLGIICGAGILIIAGAVGWWTLNQGDVVDSRALFDYSQTQIAGIDVGAAGEKALGEPLGPYDLGPEDNLVLVRATFSTMRDFKGRVPDFRLVMTAKDSEGNTICRHQKWIRRSRKQKKAKKTLISRKQSVSFPTLKIKKADRYTFEAASEKNFRAWLRGRGRTGRAALTLTIRKHVAPFPWALTAIGFGLVALGAVLYAVIPKQGEAEPA
jgi:hypothetical protein